MNIYYIFFVFVCLHVDTISIHVSYIYIYVYDFLLAFYICTYIYIYIIHSPYRYVDNTAQIICYVLHHYLILTRYPSIEEQNMFCCCGRS